MSQGFAGLLLPGALLAGLLLAGCGGESATSEPGVLTTEKFVEVLAALREAEREVAQVDTTGALFDERRADILALHDVTEEDLRRFLEVHAADTDLLYVVWDSINERLKRPIDFGEDPMEFRPGPPAY